MKVYWKLNYNKTECKPIEFVKETECFVTYAEKDYIGRRIEKREAKEFNIYPTFEEAKQYMIDYHKNEVSFAESLLQSAKSQLKKVNDLVEPEVLLIN